MGLDGRTSAKLVSGPVEALGVDGDLTLETVSGELVVADSSAQRVHARTISGAITCDLSNPRHSEVRLATASGSITVRVREDSDLAVDLHTQVRADHERVRRGADGRPARRSPRQPGRDRRRHRQALGRLDLGQHRAAGPPGRGRRHDRGLQPRAAAALPAQAARRRPQARLRADPPARGPVPRALRAQRRHDLPAPAADGGRGSGAAHGRRRAQGLRDHRRGSRRAGRPGRRGRRAGTRHPGLRARPRDARERDRAGGTGLRPRPQAGAARRRAPDPWLAGDGAAPSQPPFVASDAQEAFDRRLGAFAEEVRVLVRRGNLSDEQLRTATRLLDGALDGLRRMVR